MAVLCDAYSVIVSVEALNRWIPGGLETYRRRSSASFCTDGVITRVGFMHPNDALIWIEDLEAVGLQFVDDRSAKSPLAMDIAVVDQMTGTTCRAPWLETEVEDGIRWAWMADSGRGELCAPDGWTREHSLSLTHLPQDAVASGVIRTPNMDQFIDPETGNVRYTGRAFSDVQSYEEAIEAARHEASRGRLDEAYRHVQRAEAFQELAPSEKQLAARLAYSLSLGTSSPRPERFREARTRAFENTELGAGSSDARDWFERARLEMTVGDPEAAKMCLAKAADLDPGDPYVWCERAFVGVHMREPKEQVSGYLDKATVLALERGVFPQVTQYIAHMSAALKRRR